MSLNAARQEKIIVESNAEDLAIRAAALFYEALLTSDKPAFSVALSGGSTPKRMFGKLAAAPLKDDVPWRQVHLFWGDERCVPPDDKDSNYGMTRQTLLDHIDIPDSNIHRIIGENESAAEARRYAAVLKSQLPMTVAGIPVFDLLFLGLGSDGHTASVFPDSDALDNTSDICLVASHPESGQQRVSLSLPVINNARMVIFLVSGKSKQERIAEILGDREGHQRYPAARVQPTHGRLVWLLDQDAAEKLPVP